MMSYPNDDAPSIETQGKDACRARRSCALSLWYVRIRLAFWILGTTCGAVLTYTTRYYINGDAITYFDMAEALRSRAWPDVVNLTYAPGYSILLGILGSILPCDDQLLLAKGLNFVCFLGAVAACDLFITRVGKALLTDSEGAPLPMPVFAAICYSAFLVCSLVWVRVQIVAPDLMIFSFVLLCCVILMKIRSSPESFSHFGLLGLLAGLGYLFKTFFFPFSLIFFLLAASCCGSVRKAVPRVLFAMAVMLVIGSPILISQSMKAGRLSYGESGNYNYTYFVAGRGERIHLPHVIHENPKALSYELGTITTYPHGVDPAYWNLGIKPSLNVRGQLAALWENLSHLIGRIFLPTIAILVWFCAQFWWNSLAKNILFPPSPAVMLSVICLAGTLMYCMVVMEIRYVGPFVYLGFVALISLPRYHFDHRGRLFKVLVGAGLLVAVLLLTVAHSLVDQTLRSLYTLDGKRSHRESFMEAEAVKEFLNSQGLHKGDRVAIVLPFNERLYWAVLAGVRITAELPDGAAFLKDSPANRENALTSLRKSGFKSVVGADPSFGQIIDEGWIKVPGTSGYFVMILNGKPKTGILRDSL